MYIYVHIHTGMFKILKNLFVAYGNKLKFSSESFSISRKRKTSYANVFAWKKVGFSGPQERQTLP